MTAAGLRWEEILLPLLQKYKLNITWGDQDLLNIIFHHNPGLCCHIHIVIPFIYSKNVKRNKPLDNQSNYVSFISTRLLFVAVLQKVCMCSPASGTTVRTTVSMAATVKRLNKPVSSFSMVTEEFSMMTSSQLFEPSTRPSRR